MDMEEDTERDLYRLTKEWIDRLDSKSECSIYCLTEKWISVAEDKKIPYYNSDRLFTLYRNSFLTLEKSVFGEKVSERTGNDIAKQYDKVRDSLVRMERYDEETINSAKDDFSDIENPCENYQEILNYFENPEILGLGIEAE